MALRRYGFKIHLIPIFVNDRYMVQMETGTRFVLDLLILPVDFPEASGLKFDPFQACHGDEPKGIGVVQCLDHRFHHGQIRDIKSRHNLLPGPCSPHDLLNQFHRVTLWREFCSAALLAVLIMQTTQKLCVPEISRHAEFPLVGIKEMFPPPPLEIVFSRSSSSS